MRPVRVGINLLYLKPGRVGGSEDYVRRLLVALNANAARDVELTLFVNRQFPAAHPQLAGSNHTVVAPISGDHPSVRVFTESTWLARETAKRPIALVHHVANTAPHVSRRPALVTIHDLQPIVRPHDFGRFKASYLRRRLGPTARKATVIATLSQYVRQLVIDRFGVDPARVVVVPPPVQPQCQSSAARNGGPYPSPYFVYPAITHPHKNHTTLIRAFAGVVAEHPQASLLLTGGSGAAEVDVQREIVRLGLVNRVLRPGRVPRADLDQLLLGATAMTFPSRHEGYGLPVAEAMALGCAVIASNTTALPEVVGNAGLLVDPDDVDGWTEAMLRLVDDDALRARLVARGRAQVASLTPAETARRMVAAYRLALGDG